MEKLAQYRQIIKDALSYYLKIINQHPKPNKETEVVFDEERDHYMLINTGWENKRRIRGTTFYVRIRNEKFWIEEDWTDSGIVPELLAAGVPKEDIVLAFHTPEMREYTEFAVA